jgi:hypothetical protein
LHPFMYETRCNVWYKSLLQTLIIIIILILGAITYRGSWCLSILLDSCWPTLFDS